jgi:hypothetical protein
MRALFGITAIALAGAVSASASAQQSLQSQLAGTWKITAVYDQYTDGHKQNPWGNNPQGRAEYTSGGTVIYELMSGDRSAKPGTGPRDPVGPAIAYFGTYTVDEQNKTYTFQIQQCTFPQWNGISRTSTVADISPSTLKTVGATIHDPQGGDFQPHLEFERVK